jgi:hypothetical protein
MKTRMPVGLVMLMLLVGGLSASVDAAVAAETVAADTGAVEATGQDTAEQ